MPTAQPVSTLTPNAFIGKTENPTDQDLAEALGSLKTVWDQLVADMAAQHDVTIQEWRCYSLKAGWSLRLKRKKRTVLWMSPCQGSFRVMFILGDKAVRAAREIGLPARVLQILDQAEKYPEGTGIRLEIHGPRDLAAVKKLAVVKLEN